MHAARLVEIIILSIIQGTGEFLPISSSGHLVVATAIFDQVGQQLHEKLTVGIVLHLGTLLTIFLFYGRRIGQLFLRDWRLLGLLLVGSIPAGIVGVGYRLWLGPLLEARFGGDPLESPLVAGLMFPCTGVLLLWCSARPVGTTDCRSLRWGHALLIGAFQAVAILPGLSRSGATIGAGLLCGLKRDEAATFSFLLAVPAIAGAGLVEAIHWVHKPVNDVAPALLLLGAALSCLIGVVSLWWLLRWLNQGRLHLFAWWVLALGPIVLLWQLLSH